ncbi:MAG: 4Fe-4S dicluster domain-containing protein [Planctomycetota bacterium]|nr:4Fe-4S dicluster domain-containing protein [Planctomycetota bacterium]
MERKMITAPALSTLVTKLNSAGYRVFAPAISEGLTTFTQLVTGDKAVFSNLNTRLSLKGIFFPATEPLLRYKLGKSSVEVEDIANFAPKTVVIGARPCDASALPALDALFSWDYNDKFYLERRKNTTVVTMACSAFDDACFCTSVGGAPDNKAGSDVLLIKSGASFIAEPLTEKGKAVIDAAPDLFAPAGDQKGEVAGPRVYFDRSKIKPWLESNFDSPLWAEFAAKCLSCGCCTFVCPNCHCFDIVDEGGLKGGKRVKNWDGCQFPLFTLHTSGHNPRPTKAARWRQRVAHKFSYYVDKFNCLSCVGCGRCIRHCPVNMDIRNQLAKITG